MARYLSAVITLAVPLAYCSAAPVPKDKDGPSYFPLRYGTAWEYEDEHGKKVEKWIERVEDRFENTDKAGSEVQVTSGRAIPADRIYTITKEGVSASWAIGGFRIYEKPFVLLKLPHQKNNSWFAGTIMPVGSDKILTCEAMATGPEKLKVPAGEFDAIKVEYRAKLWDDSLAEKPTLIMYFAPGVGPVKEVAGEKSLTLRKFTLPPDPRLTLPPLPPRPRPAQPATPLVAP